MKNPAKCIIVLIFIQISFPLFSQFDFKHFPIDSFKLPSINWTGLELGGTITGSYDYGHELQGERKSNASYFSPQGSLQYIGFINRPDIQSSYYLSTDPVFSIKHYNNTITDHLNTYRYFSPDVRLSWTQLKYHNKSFFESGIYVYADYFHEYIHDERDTVITTNKQYSYTGSISIPFGFGKGRLEPVSDIVMALFLLQDAVGIGLDSQAIQSEDVVAFGELMATVRNQRVFDSRRKRVNELRSLYDFMLAKGWVLHDDPGFFTVLTDNWIYNFNYPRYSGNRWTYLLTPRLSYNVLKLLAINGGDSKDIIRSFGGEASIEYAHYKQQSLYRNFRRIHRIQLGITDRLNKFADVNTTSTILNGEFSNTIGYGWFPNSRTQIISGLGLTYNYYKYLKSSSQNLNEDQHVLNLLLSVDCNYFLTYNTRFKVYASMGYVHNTGNNASLIGGNFVFFSNGSDGINAYLNASVSVFLF